MKKLIILFLAAILLLSPSSMAEAASANDAAPLSYDDPSLWAWWAEGDHPVDLFLICPVVDMGRDGNLNMDVTSEKMRGKFMSALMQEKGLYDGTCSLYAPYYRQATFPAFEGADGADAAFDLAYGDIRAAFLHYLSASDRPFILAGFSEGADMSLRLMKDVFRDPKISDRLVASYQIGWRVTKEDLAEAPWLKMAQGAADTGCIICYDAEAPEIGESMIVPKDVHTLSINPLNWRTDGTPADRSLNRGACFTNGDGEIDTEIPALTGAYIDEVRGTLKVPDVSPADYPGVILPDGVYHLDDFFFFYRNLQQNVADRVQAYLGSGGIEPGA